MSGRLGLERDWYLLLIAAGIGLLMGGVATAFIIPLRFIEHWVEDWNASETGSGQPIWMWALVVVSPGIGGLLAGYVIHLIGASGRGMGVSAVMYAVHREKSKLPLKMAARKWIASTLTIASGGSAGAEGPIVTIGAAIGSNIGQWLRTNPQNTATLLGCGAAAGISSIFGAPIAGIFFCLEILLRDFSLRTFTPIVIASVISSVWTQTMLGEPQALFPVPSNFFLEGEFITLNELPNFFILGLACGVFAPMLIRMLFLSDSMFSGLKLHPALRPGVGGILLGVVGLVYLLIAAPDDLLIPFFGNGYPVTNRFMDPSTYFLDPVAKTLNPIGGIVIGLLVITALKAIGTCLTLGSGGAGGMFAPSLLMGAGLGGAIGTLLHALGLFPVLNPAHYALVGMAAMVGSTTHAPLTGIFVAYEITDSNEIVLPLMFTTVISTIVARLVTRDSVYTWNLSRMGVQIGQMSDLTILRRLAVSDVPLADAVIVHPNDSAQRLLELIERSHAEDYVVVDHDTNAYVGMVVGADIRMAMLEREAIPLLLVYELERTDLPTVSVDETLDVVLDKFSLFDVHSLAVLDARREGMVLGVITRDRLMRRYQEALTEG